MGQSSRLQQKKNSQNNFGLPQLDTKQT